MYVRKNAASLTEEEWTRFNRAVVTLKHTFPPGASVSVYDQFVAIHFGVFGLRFDTGQNPATGPAAGIDGAHVGPAFLPWHREYIRRFEKALQAVDPSVALPYWNWGLGPAAETTTIFEDLHIGPAGSGGLSGFEVAVGYYAQFPNEVNPLGWTIHGTDGVLRHLKAGLKRNRELDMGALPTTEDVQNALQLDSYSEFRPALEAGPRLHNFLHGWVGQDMATMTSPNDPVFFLHHCQVDRIWALWQQNHPGPDNYNPDGIGGYGHRLTDRMWPWDNGQSSPGGPAAIVRPLIPTFPATDIVTPEDVLDYHPVGYRYEPETGI